MKQGCVRCGRTPTTDIELIVAKEKVRVRVCFEHYAWAWLYENYAQSPLRELVQKQIPRGISKALVPRIRTRVKKR